MPPWLELLDTGTPAGYLFVMVRKEPNGGWHAGLVSRRNPSGVANLLHLEEHHRLTREQYSGGSPLVRTSIPVERQALIATKCRLIAKKHQEGGIPYGFSYTGSSFDRGGSLILSNKDVGLTCATFVLAVFQSEGYALCDLATFPSDPDGNAKFHDAIISRLKNQGADEHATALERERLAPRIRPTAAAGAAGVFVGQSVSYGDCHAAGERIASAIATQQSPSSGSSAP